MKETIIAQCLEIIRRKDVKNEFKSLISPVIEILVQEIYPYLYLSLLFLIMSFILNLGILILLVRNKNISKLL